MMGARRARRVAALALLALAAGCASGEKRPLIEPTTIGPTALGIFLLRTYLATGREANFDERRRWQDRLDERVSRHLRQHPELEQTSRYMDFRGWHQVGPDSTRAEVRVLLEEPDEVVMDRERMRQLVEHHWPAVAGQVTEGWRYPGWVLFFDERALVRVFKVGAGLPPAASLPSN